MAGVAELATILKASSQPLFHMFLMSPASCSEVGQPSQVECLCNPNQTEARHIPRMLPVAVEQGRIGAHPMPACPKAVMCVCMCVRACVCVCVRVCVHARAVWVCIGV